MTKDEAQTMQIRVLADRLAMVIALCDDESIECFLDGDAAGGEFWEHLKVILLKDDASARFKQAELRGSEFYAPALEEVREFMRGILRSLKQVA